MTDQRPHPGRLLKASENFLSNEQIAEVAAGRRDFLRKAFLAGGGLTAALMGKTLAADGDSAILNLPSWSKTLGKPVASTGYGTPSQYEHNLQRRDSPGLTRVSASSVSFAPLQGPIGIITPSGLHFERHHQGWQDIDPNDIDVSGVEPSKGNCGPQRRRGNSYNYEEIRMALAYTRHTQDFATLPQIAPGDLETIAEAGFKTVINNRPDGEGGPSQPSSAELESAAHSQGLRYAHLPVITSNITGEHALTFSRLLDELPKPILAFCRTGTRSTMLFQMT